MQVEKENNYAYERVMTDKNVLNERVVRKKTDVTKSFPLQRHAQTNK
jgi:hypothetical protein